MRRLEYGAYAERCGGQLAADRSVWHSYKPRGNCRQMCGIVGLLIKNPALRPILGELISPMLVCMGDRGPDSAGLAVFSEPVSGSLRRFSLYDQAGKLDWPELQEHCRTGLGVEGKLFPRGNHAVLQAALPADRLKPWLAATYPRLHLLSVGRSIDVYKDTGHPREIAERYRFRTADRHARRRPHADGDRVGRLAGPRASLHGGRGFLPGAQRLAVESRTAFAASSKSGASVSRPTTTPRPPAGSSNGG